MPHIPEIDRLSFWFGFLAASLFWWVITRVRPVIPVIRGYIKKFFRDIRERNLEGASNYLRKDTLQRAQKLHLAAALFPLDDILIKPRLIASPVQEDPDHPLQVETMVDQVIPYLPDWPEIGSTFGATLLSPAEALLGGSNIAVIGQPGCGKTVCLAYLASQIARRETAVGPLIDYVPLYLHVLDLDSSISTDQDPAENLIKAVSSRAPVLLQNQLKRLIIERFKESRVVVILDGLDEIPPSALAPVTLYLKSLLDKYPHNRLIVAASPEYIDGLDSLHFAPLSLTVWGLRQHNEYLERWSTAWSAAVGPDLNRQSSFQVVPPLLLNNWLVNERMFWSPLEWTIKVWASYAGDLLTPTPAGAIETFISRSLNHVVTHNIAELLAKEFVVAGKATMKYSDLVKMLNNRDISAYSEAQQTPPAAAMVDSSARQSKEKGSRDIILSVGEQILETLLQGGILTEHVGQTIRFSNPVFAGFLASFSMDSSSILTLLQQPFWSNAGQALRYTAAFSSDTSWVDPFIHADTTPLHRNLLTVARWLADAPANAAWRSQVFRQMIFLFQSEKLPFSLRARLSAAFGCSNDPAIGRLFRQLIGSSSPELRQLVLLGVGTWGDPTLVNDILGMLNDPAIPVRYTACLALVAIQSESSLRAVTEALYHSDEGVRQTAAEALAQSVQDGPDILRKASADEDILTRRASVFGLMQINEPWTIDLLQKIAVEDAQWVVRNVASQVLESLQSPNPHIPKPLPIAWVSPRLIAFAAKHGMGITPGVPPFDLLLLALNSGVLADQLLALEYVKELPEERFFAPVYMLFTSTSYELREAALYTLWYWAISGIKFPPPSKFGLYLT